MTFEFRKRLDIFRRAPKAGSAPGTIEVDPASPPPVITCIDYGAEEFLEETVDSPEDLRRFVEKPTVTWVNVDGLGDESVLHSIAGTFGLHRLAMEDVVNVTQRPKLEVYGDHLFVVARMPMADAAPATEQVSIFVGPNFVLTFQERAGDCFDSVRSRLRSARPRIRQAGPDYLAYALLDAVVDAYFPVLETYAEVLDDLEAEIFADPDDTVLPRLHMLKRDLLSVRRTVWSLREVTTTLAREDTPVVADDTRPYLRDCHDHTVQLLELVESFRESSSSLVDFYLSQVSQKMNEVMKVLTIIATIFIPITFIAGIYGMNFDPAASGWNMPELGWRWGYPASLLLMAVVTVVMLEYFRRKRWILGRRRDPDRD
jgi:magnesium transporter